jgi:hypothetical protein
VQGPGLCNISGRITKIRAQNSPKSIKLTEIRMGRGPQAFDRRAGFPEIVSNISEYVRLGSATLFELGCNQDQQL